MARDAPARKWVFTLNNYTEADIERIKGVLKADACYYAVVGKEVGESGTPHLQGFVHFKARIRLTAPCKKLHDKAHWVKSYSVLQNFPFSVALQQDDGQTTKSEVTFKKAFQYAITVLWYYRIFPFLSFFNRTMAK